MNYIKEAENLLWYYNDLYKSIRKMEREIGKLVASSGPSLLSAMEFEGTGSKGSRDENTYNLLFQLQTTTDNLSKTRKEFEKVNTSLDEISQEKGCELFGKVLRMWYIERLPKEEIAAEIGYSSKQSIYDLKNRAIKKFAVSHFGLDALKTI